MGGRIRRALPASTRNQLWLTGLFLALLALFMMTGARAFLAWPMYESLLSTLPLYGFLALGLTLVVAAGEMDLCFPSTLAVAGFGFALTAIHTGQVWLGVIVAILIGLGIGLCNGFLVAYVGVPSIIATIGTQFSGARRGHAVGARGSHSGWRIWGKAPRIPCWQGGLAASCPCNRSG